MKQYDIFGELIDVNIDDDSVDKYTKKILAPIYEIKGDKPRLGELYDKSKFDRIVSAIKSSNLQEEEKNFLILSATRFIVFKFDMIAEYYANSSRDFQELAEKCALVVIDFDKAIQNGFTKLSEKTFQKYLSDE